MVCLFSACACLRDVGVGSQGHGRVVKMGLEGSLKVCNALMEGVSNGREVFDDMPHRNEIAWTIMIVDYFGDVVMGRSVHVYGLKMMGMEMDIMVETAILDIYAKCGRGDTAIKVFKCMPQRNVMAWNAMLSGLAMHGRGRVVVEMFWQMIKEVRPDDLNFIATHSGMIDQGYYYFDLQSVYGITPKINHYACMVGLLGRAGRLEEAETLINQMPIPPNEVVLGSLLEDMIRRLQLAGYVPNLAAQVFPDSDGVEDAGVSLEKEQALFSHSEKLAVCFGLLSTKPGKPLYIFKNLRLCHDCHAAIKIVSKIYDREIAVRDQNRFHCFKEGSCSCCDFW
ncbi:Vesicle transport v-SNARE family protein [Hibiscus syriacus]|uniref:Vesicle transport v-SNARE family protein n=2 Tax=Hibiscus syriacus TaxID=106335 RepID=A0A6A2Y4Y2_HIBSY|nr:Vesicle transport v-SNARE family protein [Hibiscus syriacus]